MISGYLASRHGLERERSSGFISGTPISKLPRACQKTSSALSPTRKNLFFMTLWLGGECVGSLKCRWDRGGEEEEEERLSILEEYSTTWAFTNNMGKKQIMVFPEKKILVIRISSYLGLTISLSGQFDTAIKDFLHITYSTYIHTY